MAGSLITLDARTRTEWRRWLEKHHASSPGVWIHTAKRPETRDRRIRESIELLAAGQKLGLK